MRRHHPAPGLVAIFAIALSLGGCETLTVPDFNNPGIDQLTGNPTRSGIQTAAQGLMIGARRGIGGFNRYVSALGVLGRESYIFDPSDPRFVTEILQGPLDPAGASFGGGGHWADRYRNIRNANILLEVMDSVAVRVAANDPTAPLSAEEIEAIRGFAKTLQAHDLLLVVNTRDDFGAPIDVGGSPTGDPAPIVDTTAVYDRILQLLDDAATHLGNAGTEFPFSLSSGFTGFETPAEFITFNRALKARVLVYRREWSDALTALAASFLDDSPGQGLAGLNVGVYHAYGTGPGDEVNDLFGRRGVLPAHPSIATDAQAGDARLTRKTVTVSPPVEDIANLGVSSDLLFTVYSGLSAKIPFIRNEELLLLRAEANLQMGNLDAARTDINLVRTISGGLAAIDQNTWENVMTAAEREDELLYNRRYSLLFEGGHRWIDLRRYGRLDELPVDHASFRRFRQLPIPEAECAPRTPRPTGCTQIAGF
jgi:hypothetical protein